MLESKLHRPGPPRRRAAAALLARLRAWREMPIVAVAAPARYGKTALLALWAEADDRSFARLSLDRHDNDPIVLLTHLAVALDRVGPLPPEVFDALRSAGVSVPATVVPRLGSALARLPRPLVLVLDDVHHLEDGTSLDALLTLVGHPRGTAQLALAGCGMPVPLARQRARGQWCPRRWRLDAAEKPLPHPWAATTPGGLVPSDDELLEGSLAFSGTYVSDDGHVTIRRSSGSSEYSGARFTGYCALCSRAGLIPPTGEPLSDVRAAVEFIAVHRHGEVD